MIQVTGEAPSGATASAHPCPLPVPLWPHMLSGLEPAQFRFVTDSQSETTKLLPSTRLHTHEMHWKTSSQVGEWQLSA